MGESSRTAVGAASVVEQLGASFQALEAQNGRRQTALFPHFPRVPSLRQLSLFLSFQTEAYTHRQAHTHVNVHAQCSMLGFSLNFQSVLHKNWQNTQPAGDKKITLPQSLSDHRTLWLINPVSGTFFVLPKSTLELLLTLVHRSK